MRGSHGLSARGRRARRTKSRRPEGPKAGPKGRQLEVGARRASRLLVAGNSLEYDYSKGVANKRLLATQFFLISTVRETFSSNADAKQWLLEVVSNSFEYHHSIYYTNYIGSLK